MSRTTLYFNVLFVFDAIINSLSAIINSLSAMFLLYSWTVVVDCIAMVMEDKYYKSLNERMSEFVWIVTLRWFEIQLIELWSYFQLV